MCGFAGFLGYGYQAAASSEVVTRMAEKLSHRGPDAAGIWVDEATEISLAHRRLSIVDLSSAGAQPMQSTCGRYVIAFNGEIYNHNELRKELGAGEPWRSHSDTETLLAGISAWGILATLERCIGMFAFAVWDKAEQVLTLARDRLGEKPLYYGWQGSGARASFIFGSELTALKVHPAFTAEINRDALSLMMSYSYIPAPHSIYQGIYKLMPGYMLTVSLMRREPILFQYWSLQQVAERGVASPFAANDDDIIDSLDVLLKNAVGQQMAADVPLGAFLSGGIDSSTIVALMQAQSSRPVKTFTIGFNEAGFNEAEHAKVVANHLKTDHTELYITPKQVQEIIPNLPEQYSEPFSDVSQMPNYFLAKLARQNVKVALSGDGGDELFCGYRRYILARDLWRKLGQFPQELRAIGSLGICALTPELWNSLSAPLRNFLPMSLRKANIGDKMHKGASVLGARNEDELYLKLITLWDSDDLVLGGRSPLSLSQSKSISFQGLDPLQRMMLTDTLTYLPDDILVKVDRSAMSVSLEGRVPFLDHRVVEFAWRMPQRMKLHNNTGKWALRQVLYRYVPKELIDRPKMGFSVPIDSWLRGPLREWAESLLDESRIKQEGFLNPMLISKKWKEHLSGRRNWQDHLWAVLMFESWLEAQGA